MRNRRGEGTRSAEHALVIRDGGRRVVRRATEFVIPRDAKSLCWRNALVLQTVLGTAVKDAHTLHRK